MEQLEHLSFKGQKALFARLEELARRANMNKKERDEYEACLKVYRDNYSIALYRKRQEEAKFQEGLQIGKEEGREEGIEIGILKTARQMKQNKLNCVQV